MSNGEAAVERCERTQLLAAYRGQVAELLVERASETLKGFERIYEGSTMRLFLARDILRESEFDRSDLEAELMGVLERLAAERSG